MRAVSADRVAGSVLVLFSAFVAWESRALPLGGFGNPGPGALPLGLAVILGSLGGLVAWRGGGTALAHIAWPEAARAVGILGATAFAAAAIETLGYRATIFCVVLFLLGALERKRALPAALAAFGLAQGSYWLFADLLKTPLPVGPFGF